MQPPKPLHQQGVETHIADPNARHEHTDISITGIVAFIVTLMFCGIVIFVVLIGAFKFATRYALEQDRQDMRDPWVRSEETQVDQAAKKLQTPENRAHGGASMELSDAEQRVRVTRFPQPRLQTDDARDLGLMREAEDVYLGQYFVLDKKTGKVNIPIDAAMQAVVQKGLPSMALAPGAQLPTEAESTGIVRPSIGSSHNKQRGSPLKER
ncbi:MAG TPA: hypothetical protein VFQ00_14210 [Terriglobales bacterium]|nr:hypothetical protein [Terriglobales bacterium]